VFGAVIGLALRSRRQDDAPEASADLS